MATEFFGCRLNDKKPEHKEILDWLGKFEDRSDEGRRLMLLGIRVSRGELRVPEPKVSGPITWSFPKEPSVENKIEKSSAMRNILQSFG
jgi:hypothetical protein